MQVRSLLLHVRTTLSHIISTCFTLIVKPNGANISEQSGTCVPMYVRTPPPLAVEDPTSFGSKIPSESVVVGGGGGNVIVGCVVVLK